MHIVRAHWGAVAVAALLAACTDGPTAPAPTNVAPVFGTCGEALMTKAATTSSRDAALSVGQLPLVTVTATYSSASTGLPFNLVQIMNYSGGAGLDPTCGGGPENITITAAEPEDTLPTPPEVDASWWTTLSPRERAVIFKYARIYMDLHPDEFTSPGRVIAVVFQDRVPTVKSRSKQRTMDYPYQETAQELLYAGIYACKLYQNFLFDEFSPLMPDQVADLASSLAAAFGATLNYQAPLRGIAFGKNAAAGVGFAVRNPHGDCGTMVYQAVGREITVTDPYNGSVPAAPDR